MLEKHLEISGYRYTVKNVTVQPPSLPSDCRWQESMMDDHSYLSPADFQKHCSVFSQCLKDGWDALTPSLEIK